MTLTKAIQIVEHYQEWRRGKIEILIYKPTSIGEAIDKLIENAKTDVSENGMDEK